MNAINDQLSTKLERPARGVALAREANRLAVWDSHWLFWTNRAGQRQAQARFTEQLAAAALSEDGSAFAVALADGQVNWLGPDLRPRWVRTLPAPATAAALDPLGLFLAVGDARGGLHIFNRDGQPFREWTCPRPARFLAFEPASGRLVAAADFGWLSAFDLGTGMPAWRDTPFVNVGGLAVTVTDGRVALACFSDGLRLYQDNGQLQRPDVAVPPCRLVTLSHDGGRSVVAGLDGTLIGLGPRGATVFTHRPESFPTALALDARGDALFAAAGDQLLAFDLRAAWGA